MLFHAEDVTDANAVNLGAAKLVAFDLGAGVCHSVAIFFDVNIVAIHKIGKPFHR
jgi:hypothetical protein